MNLCVLTYYLQNPFDGAHAFLALATSLSAWLQVILLYKNLRKSNYIMKKKSCLPMQKMSRQKSKLLMRSGGELDEMMLGSLVEKMKKGGNAKRLAYNNETGQESMQEYKLGGGTHNTYSGKRKKRK
jgi:hypothetical protein